MKIFLYFLFMFHFTAVRVQYIGYTGGSLLLSCSFTTPSIKRFSWLYIDGPGRNDIFLNKKYDGRLKLFNESLPTNLSLLISDLKKEDKGEYRCEISRDQYIDIRIIIKGCDLVQNNQTVKVTGRPGESVVLPCYCNELQAKPEELTWTFLLKEDTVKTIYSTDQSLNESDLTGIKLLNEIFPGNLSLLKLDLITEHAGVYRCSVRSQYVDIKLTVEGCDLVRNKQTVEVTGRPEESVVLPCYCKELDIPEQLSWTYYLKDTVKTIYPSDQKLNERDLSGIKLLNENSPGNLSLLISDLTTEHAGVYRCSVRSQYVDIKLTVEEKWHIQTICLSTHEPVKRKERTT